MVQFDVNSITQRIINRLRAKESWADVLFYSTNQRLIDIFAEELAYDMSYDEILTRESKWSLARQVSSLMAESQFYNYVPHRKVGASGELKISTSETFSSAYSTNIEIPKYATFSSSSNLNFVVADTTNLLNNEQYSYINIVQGTPKSESFIAQGNYYETFTIYNNSIENSVYDVYVNGELWEKIDYLREASSGSSKVYELNNLLDFSGVTIKFGNDYFGKKLSTGDIVLFQYVETDGISGNVTSTGVVTNVQSTFYDVNNNAVDLYCTNDSYLSGGLAYESIESIRVKAPKVYQSGDKAISKSDYKSIVELFSFVKKATVWGETEVNEDNGNIPGTYIASEENVIHISAITTSDVTLSSEQQLTIRETLNDKKSPTDIVVFTDVIVV